MAFFNSVAQYLKLNYVYNRHSFSILDQNQLYTDNELFLRISRGDEKAFGDLFHRWKDRVFGIAYRFTEHPFRSEEIVQDVFLHLWTNRTRLPGIDQPEAWIYTVTRNRSMTAFKTLLRDASSQAHMLEYLPRQEAANSGTLELDDLKRTLAQALDLLTPQQRRVFELSRIEGFDREAVALEMGIAKATVSVHLTVALRTVRAYLLTRLDALTVLLLLREFF